MASQQRDRAAVWNARQWQVIAELSNELRQIKLEVSGMNGKLGNLVTHTAAHTCSHTRNTDVSAVAGNRRANASETHHARLVLAFRTLHSRSSWAVAHPANVRPSSGPVELEGSLTVWKLH